MGAIEPGTMLTIAVSIGGQVIGLVWAVATMKGDGRVLQAQMADVRTEVARLSTVLVEIANVKGELMMQSERGMLQGKRVDELTNRLNRWLDGDKEPKP